MSAFGFFLISVLLLALLVWTPCLVVVMGLLTVGENRHQPWRNFGSFGNITSLLLCNAIVLTIFCSLWYWGYFMSEHWMHIIDIGGPWSWLAALSIASYFVSLLRLRRHAKRLFTSLVGPVITVPVFCLWVIFCAMKFDPYF